jgi:uncharacterized membrane protein/nucleoside 2-deoxyribosyltransferase
MDRVSDGGVEWRLRIRNTLRDLGINWLDPCDKPIDIGLEDMESRALRRQYKKQRLWAKVAELMKPIRCVDLRMVDVCDFIVVLIDVDNHACGTYEEIFWANRMKKPIFVMVAEDVTNIPDWLVAALPHEYFHDSWESLFEHVERVDHDPAFKDDHKRWYFFNWMGADSDTELEFKETYQSPVFHPDPSKRMRTLVKSVGWEAFSFILTLLISYLVVGSVEKATKLTAILFATKVFFLYGYERLWHKIRWGKHARK